MAVVRALFIREFALLWMGQTLSRLGDNIFRVALNVWLVEKTGSVKVIAAAMSCLIAPMLVFLLLGGVIADKVSRVRIIFASDAVRAATAASITSLALFGRLEVWMICAANVIYGIASAFFRPAYVSLVPELVSDETLNSANSLTAISEEVCGVIGPVIGAFIVTFGSFAAGVGADAVSFAISGACLIPIMLSPHVARHDSIDSPVMSSLSDGLATVLASPWLYCTIMLFALSNITLVAPIAVALPVLVHSRCNGITADVGLVYSAVAIGSVVAGIVVARVKKPRFRGPIAYLALLLDGVMILIVGLPLPFGVVVCAMFVFGAATSVSSLMWFSSLYELIPSAKLGRVSSIDQLGSLIFFPIGCAAAGLLTEHFSVQSVFLWGGGTTIGLVLIMLTRREVRLVD